MKNYKKTLLFLIFISLFTFSKAQTIDKYGLKVGMGLSNQLIEYEIFGEERSSWKDDNLGFNIYINAEKKLSNSLTLRPELGYIQKGFKDEITFTDVNGQETGKYKDNVILHNVSLNLGLKIIPFEYTFNPYLIAGFRGDYLIDYKDFKIDNQSEGIYKFQIEEYNNFVLSGLIGLGVEYKKLLYLEMEFNPAITKNINRSNDSAADEALLPTTVKDGYFGFAIGVQINELFSKE